MNAIQNRVDHTAPVVKIGAYVSQNQHCATQMIFSTIIIPSLKIPIILSVQIFQYFQQFCGGAPVSDGHGLVGRCTHHFVKTAFSTLRAKTL